MGTTSSTSANAPTTSPNQSAPTLERRRSAGARTSIREAVLSVTGRRAMSQDAVRSSHDDTGERPVSWVFVKAKTRQHNSNRVVRKNIWFEAKPNAELTIGRQDCDLILDDDRCAAVNARLIATNDAVLLIAEARMYRLIGMGFKPRSALVPLSVGMVIKVGSVSLEVTSLCTKEGDNFLERFESELAAHTKKKHALSDGQTEPRMSTDRESLGDVTDQSEDEEDVEEDKDSPAVCYICWGGPDDPVGMDELNAVRKKGEKKHNGTKSGDEEKRADPNPLIRNPCGKCSGSSRYVHLQCILTWIKSSGSGHCSICNGALPQHFSSPPPNIELKVVRHRRGHSWVGTRRFRLSFVDKPTAVIGRDADADVRLSDRSVCGLHARITFEKEEKRFVIQDCASMTGTYVQLVGQMELPPDEATYLKIGRTTLSVRLTQRRTSLIRSLLPSSMTRG